MIKRLTERRYSVIEVLAISLMAYGVTQEWPWRLASVGLFLVVTIISTAAQKAGK